MKQFFLAVLAALTLVGCRIEAETPWETACRISADVYSCEGLDEPTVEYFSPTSQKSGLNGYYEGDSTIYINDTLVGWKKKATMFHEIVHYLQVQTGSLQLPGPAFLVCRAEDEAFYITDIYVELVLGIEGEARHSYWWKPYWYCWEWYAPKDTTIFMWSGGDEVIVIIIQ